MSAFKQFQRFHIKPEMPQSVGGKAETLEVRFKDRSLLQDESGNHLKTEVLTGPALRQIKLPSGVETLGQVVRAASFLTLGAMLGMNLFQSVAVGSFWSFINMLQVIAYLPVIPCAIPDNFLTFLEEYLTIGEFAIPFDMLPDFIPKPERLFEFFDGIEFNVDFKIYSFESPSFLHNFMDELSTWFLLLLFYLAINLLLKLRPTSK